MSGGLRPNLGGFLLANQRRNAPRLAPPAECCCSLEAGGGLEFEWFRGGGGQLQWEAVWAVSRRWRNRLHRALHGNIQLVVANVTALSNLRLALAGEPDEVVPQELWATRLQRRRPGSSAMRRPWGRKCPAWLRSSSAPAKGSP